MFTKKHYVLVIKGALILETKFSGILEEYYLIFNNFEEYGRNSDKQNLFSYDLFNFKPKLKNIIKFYIKLIK